MYTTHSSSSLKTLATIKIREEQAPLAHRSEDAKEMRGQAFLGTIMGGFSDSKGATKRKITDLMVVQATTSAAKITKGRPMLGFVDDKKVNEVPNEDLPLVIVAGIYGHDVARCLVDVGNYEDIMYQDAFKKLGLGEANLKVYRGTDFYGFDGVSTRPWVYVELGVTFGKVPNNWMVGISFVVIPVKSVYNCIFDRAAKEIVEGQLQGKLFIKNLQNVIDVVEAYNSNLKWGDETGDSLKGKDVLDKLQPPINLKRLNIDLYGGTSFPSYLGDSSFSNMVSLCINKCAYCVTLPQLCDRVSEFHLSGGITHGTTGFEITAIVP